MLASMDKRKDMKKQLCSDYELICLVYDISDDSMGANSLCVEEHDTGATFSFNLEPKGSNHLEDITHLDSCDLQRVQIDNQYVIDGLSKFLSIHNVYVSELIMRFKSKEYKYKASIEIINGILWINISKS